MKCKECRFAIILKTQVIGQWVGQCRRDPPTPLLIPQGNNVGVTSAFPAVSENDYCFRYEFKSEIDKIVDKM
jgi:hypothetical protein